MIKHIKILYLNKYKNKKFKLSSKTNNYLK